VRIHKNPVPRGPRRNFAPGMRVPNPV
jgi:hypothetical protein